MSLNRARRDFGLSKLFSRRHSAAISGVQPLGRFTLVRSLNTIGHVRIAIGENVAIRGFFRGLRFGGISLFRDSALQSQTKSKLKAKVQPSQNNVEAPRAVRNGLTELCVWISNWVRPRR